LDESNKKAETKLLDYQTQQRKFFPLLAYSYAFIFTGSFIWEKYEQLLKDVKE
jgi:hypothetical protein